MPSAASTRLSLLVFALGTLLGSLAALIWVPAVLGAPIRGALPDSQPDVEPERVGPGDTPLPTPRRSPDDAAPAASLDTAVARWIETVGTPDRATGTAGIRVRVVDGDGEPVAGAIIDLRFGSNSDLEFAHTMLHNRPEPGLTVNDLREHVATVVAADSRRRRLTTDATGLAAADDLPAGEVSVEGRHASAVIRGESLSLAADAVTRVQLSATRLLPVTLDVRGPDDKPRRSARIRWGGTNESRWTPETPTIPIRPRSRVMIECVDGDDPSLAASVERSRIDPARTITITLIRHVTVRLRVVDPDGVAWPTDSPVWIRLLRARGATRSPLAGSATRGSTLADGAVVEFPDVPVGEYTVRLTDATAGVDLARGPLSVTGDTDQEWRVDQRPRATEIALTIVGPDGGPVTPPVSKIRVELLRSDGRRAALWDGTAVPTEDPTRFTFLYPFPPNDRDAKQTLRLRADHPDFGPAVTRIPATESAARLQFVHGAIVEISVVGISEYTDPIYATVEPVDDDEPGDIPFERVDLALTNGRVRFPPYRPGRAVHVQVSVQRRIGPGWVRLARTDTLVTLQPGINTVVLRVPPLFFLTVDVGKELAGTNVQIRPRGIDGARSGNARIDQAGFVRFGYLRPGEYQIALVRDGVERRMTVTVSGNATVQFVPDPVE
jgi:hypothetical protein